MTPMVVITRQKDTLSEAREPFRLCEELKRRLLDRFQPSQEGNLHEKFLSITQDGLARENVSLFEQLAGQLRGVSEEVMKGTFIKGLKPDLRSSVRVMQRASLGQAMKLSIMIDENKTIGGSVSNRSSLQTSVPTGNSYSNRNTGGSITARSPDGNGLFNPNGGRCAGKGGRGGSMAGNGGGWLAKRSIVSNEGCGGGGLAVFGGKSSSKSNNGACGGEVNGRGVVLGVFKSLLGEILGDVMGKRGGYTIRVDGGTVW
ncbi:ankyrin repeat-containing protein [Tanacetum coccineum]